MNTASHFKTDLEVGRNFEKSVQEYLTRQGAILGQIDGYCKEYDLKGSNFSIECKLDTSSYDTGNVAIEFEYAGQTSGIKSSEADFFVIGYWNAEIGEFQTKMFDRIELLDVLENGDYEVRVGGDGSLSKFWLCPVYVLDVIQLRNKIRLPNDDDIREIVAPYGRDFE